MGSLLEQVLDRYPKKVKLIFKHYPLKRHRYAATSAAASMAAHRRGLFWEFHDRLFKNYKRLNNNVLFNIRRELGLTDGAFDEAMKDPVIQALIDRDKNEGKKIGVTGTPTVFINGKRFAGRKNLDGFLKAVEKELGKDSGK